jgi:AraC-like DNA-binding protein
MNLNKPENRNLFLKLHFERSDEFRCKHTQVNWNIDGLNHRFDLGENYLPLTLVINKSGILNIGSGVNNFALNGNSALLMRGGNKFRISQRHICASETVFVFFGENYVREFVHAINEDQLGHPDASFGFIETVIRNNRLYGEIHSDFINNYLKYRLEGISMKDKADLLLTEIVRINLNSLQKINELIFVKPATRLELFRRLEIAVDFIETVFPSAMTLDEIAKEAALSKYHLIRAFKMVHKCSPFGYIARLKASNAMELLKNSNSSISELSSVLGFSSVQSFSSFFSKAAGFSPSVFRKNQLRYIKKAI